MKAQQLIIAILVVTAGIAFGQQPDNNARRERPPRPPRTMNMNHGNWVGKYVMEKAFLNKVGVEEERAKKLQDELGKVDAQLTALDETINKTALQQAEVAKKVLSEPGASVDEMMQIIERLGQARTDQAKLSTQILVIIRDNLTDEQRKKAQDLISAEGRKRMQERMGGRRGGERPDRPDRQQGQRQQGAGDAPQRPAAPQGW